LRGSLLRNWAISRKKRSTNYLCKESFFSLLLEQYIKFQSFHQMGQPEETGLYRQRVFGFFTRFDGSNFGISVSSAIRLGMGIPSIFGGLRFALGAFYP